VFPRLWIRIGYISVHQGQWRIDSLDVAGNIHIDLLGHFGIAGSDGCLTIIAILVGRDKFYRFAVRGRTSEILSSVALDGRKRCV
jgi:hypothetical protein